MSSDLSTLKTGLQQILINREDYRAVKVGIGSKDLGETVQAARKL